MVSVSSPRTINYLRKTQPRSPGNGGNDNNLAGSPSIYFSPTKMLQSCNIYFYYPWKNTRPLLQFANYRPSTIWEDPVVVCSSATSLVITAALAASADDGQGSCWNVDVCCLGFWLQPYSLFIYVLQIFCKEGQYKLKWDRNIWYQYNQICIVISARTQTWLEKVERWVGA